MAQPSVIKDRSGVPFYYGDADGEWFPPFPLPYPYKDQLDVIKNLVIRDDDVIMTGYPKSGSHWHYEILSMLQRGKAEYVKSDKPTEMIDRLTAEQIAELPSPRVLNTHLPFSRLPTQAIQKRTKIVYLLRNPKDVAVSLHNHMRDWSAKGYPGSWPDFLHLFLTTGLWGNRWFDVVPQWERDIKANPHVPIFVAVYEEGIKDPEGHVMRLNDFLGFGRSPDLCRRIAEACSFNNLKVASHDPKVKVNHFQGVWKSGSSGFFRKGKVGDWKNWFSPEQAREIDEIYNKTMGSTKLNIIFDL